HRWDAHRNRSLRRKSKNMTSSAVSNDSDALQFRNATDEEINPIVSGMLSVPASVIILMTIFGNLLVLCFKARVGRTNTTLLVWNLGLTDFLVGVIVLPLGAFHLIYRKWVFGPFLCRLWVAADVTFCTCSVVTICVISVDRYMAVTRPLRYKSIVTKSRVIVVMIIIWAFSMSVPLATWKWNDLQLSRRDEENCFAGDQIRYLAHSVVLAFFLPASVTLSLYWRIYNLARKRQKALDRGFLMILGHNMNFLTNTISQQTTLRVHFGRKNGMVEHQRRVLRTHERIAKTLGVVSCSFLFCWLPFFSLYLTNFKCRCIPSLAIDMASWLGYCNSMLNPIIYSFTVKEFKRSALRMMLPLWTLAHRFLPFIRPPPDGLNLKMSRHGKNRKSRPHSFVELGKNKSGVLTSRVTRQRRQTEPAVFASLEDRKKLGKVAAKDAETVVPTTIVEESEEAYSEVNSLTSSFSSFSESRFVSPWKKSSFTRMPTLTERKSLELTTSNGVSASSGGPSEHSIRMHYDTLEADV
ncbi:hypothetical protein PMAYCL1PPCAC_21870, partial [Pristionchus mayeri]